jgi:NTP pyrophosphatase (non-canonical NTP hydrolase)
MVEHNGKRYQLFARKANEGDLIQVTGRHNGFDIHTGGVYQVTGRPSSEVIDEVIDIRDDAGEPNAVFDGCYMVMVPEPETQIQGLVQAAHQNAVNKGWWEKPASFGESLMLITSELSEALEDYRNGHAPTEEWYEEPKNSHGKSVITAEKQLSPEWKPCGVPSELADVVIRIMDMCGHYGIDLERAIQEKMAYNATRSERHGGKVL